MVAVESNCPDTTYQLQNTGKMLISALESCTGTVTWYGTMQPTGNRTENMATSQALESKNPLYQYFNNIVKRELQCEVRKADHLSDHNHLF